ncbi:MAG: amidase [Hyphomicrobiales bacterium]|nr:amidase [Hyphomicrobiales bacterium]
MAELWRLTARETTDLLRRREISPLELIDVAEARIAAVDPAINAIPIRCFDRARAHARRIMAERPAHDTKRASLHGLPIVVKDLTPVEGVRWTDGSRVYADRIASHSDFVIERLEANGAIVVGKSNTPEFGAGGNTVNDVFGATRNPWDMRLTSGGSSGGSAAAVATGEAWLATGTDMAGSIRYPSAYCSVVGLRPSAGRVAHGPRNLCFSTFNVDGPIARNVGDAALMLDAMIGEHPSDPLALPVPARSYADVVSAARSTGGRSLRVAWSPDLGVAPLDPEVREICAQAVLSFERAGAVVSEACPNLHDANGAFYILRNMQRVGGAASLLREHRELLSPEIIHYAEKGLSQSAAEIGAAENTRGAIYHRMIAFFADYDILATPTVIAPPYDIRQRHLMEVAGTKFDDFFAYLMLTSIITVTTCPAISVPCGFTASGLPVGLQLIAKPRDDAGVLAAAAIFESQHDYAARVPMDPR